MVGNDVTNNGCLYTHGGAVPSDSSVGAAVGDNYSTAEHVGSQLLTLLRIPI